MGTIYIFKKLHTWLWQGYKPTGLCKLFFLLAESTHIWLPWPDHKFRISPLATASPGMKSSGYTVSRYHLKDLHSRSSRNFFLWLISPKFPRSFPILLNVKYINQGFIKRIWILPLISCFFLTNLQPLFKFVCSLFNYQTSATLYNPWCK